jgi:beta-galactosidase
MKHIAFYIAVALLPFLPLNGSGQSPRVRTHFDFDWKFTTGDDPQYADPQYADAQWEDVRLPHDWNIGMQFDIKAGGSAAYLPESVGWYRKHFTVPAKDAGKRISILFDGIFHQSDVYINGEHLGFRPYGFCSIEYDLTPYLKINAVNVISVRVNCTGGRPRWYAGSGIYRHAWLRAVSPVHIATYGTYITTVTAPPASGEQAEIQVVSTIVNDSGKKQKVSVSQRILDNTGKPAGKKIVADAEIQAHSTTDIQQRLTITSPQLWDIDNPVLYTMETTVRAGGKITDVYTTPFGVRTFSFDADNGFSLNGRRVKLKGMCLHQDAGSLGVAVPDRSYERRLEILKEYGCNAIRCAHNPPSPEFLDMCDRMGFIVIDEAFDKWKSGYYGQYFDEWWQRDLNDMLLRDRNHPSVVLWSIGNELQEAWDESDEGVKRAAMLQDFVHRHEPGRPVNLAAQNNHQAKFSGVTDVIGYNYLESRMLSDRKKYPGRRFLVTEELPCYSGEEGNIRAYDTNNPWNIIAENDFIAGGFIWSGVDYLGEAGFPGKGWPNGLFDVCMFEKPRAAFHRAMWNDDPMVRIAVKDQSLDIEAGRDLWQWPRIAAHWNFPPAYDGLIMEVLTTTNCERVELYRDGIRMGSKKTSDFPNHTIIWNVPYKRGKLTAKGYNGNVQAAEYTLTTSGEAHRLVLSPDRTALRADGQDLSHISVRLEDSEGNPVQTDDRLLTVTVEGEGRFLGIDNGDLRREGSFAGNRLKTYFGRALIIVQSNRDAGKIKVAVTMEGSDEIYSTEITCRQE